MDFQKLRQEMVENQLKARGIKDKNVLKAFLEVPREVFVPEQYKQYAYDDQPLPIGNGQTISQPYMVAVMTELLKAKKSDKILEIGTGSGYQAAILSLLCKKVVSIERISDLVHESKEKFKKLDYNNIEVAAGDGTLGYEAEAPYDGILVTAAAPAAPPPLIGQLKTGARLVIPIGERFMQRLTVITKTKSGIRTEQHGGCIFVPLIGKCGFGEP